MKVHATTDVQGLTAIYRQYAVAVLGTGRPSKEADFHARQMVAREMEFLDEAKGKWLVEIIRDDMVDLRRRMWTSGNAEGQLDGKLISIDWAEGLDQTDVDTFASKGHTNITLKVINGRVAVDPALAENIQELIWDIFGDASSCYYEADPCSDQYATFTCKMSGVVPESKSEAVA